MKKIIAFIMLLYCCNGRSQCPFKALITNSNGNCLDTNDTLAIHLPGNISRIDWYRGNNKDTTISSVIVPATGGTTVAGGNGPGVAMRQLFYPTAVFVDAGGNLYIADTKNNRIQKFPPGSTGNSDGFTVAGGSGQGAAAYQFNAPNSVFVDGSGNIYVADAGNSRIQKFPPGSSSGTAGITVAADQLITPYSVFVDGAGNIFVADAFNNRIQKFPPGSSATTNGVVIAGGNGMGSAPNQFNFPTAVYVDGAGNLYASDYGNNRVQKFGPGSTGATNGTTVAGGNGQGAALNQVSSPYGIFVDAAGNTFVADGKNNRVLKFAAGSTASSNGVVVAGGFGMGQAPGQLNSPESIFIKDGNLFIADAENNRVQEYLANAPVTTTIDTTYLPKTPGVYLAKATDENGCTVATNAISLDALVTPGINLSVISGKVALCSNSTDTISLLAAASNGGTAPFYHWEVNGIERGANSPGLSGFFLNGDVITCSVMSSLACVTIRTVTSPDFIVSFNAAPVATLVKDSGKCPGTDTLVVISGNDDLLKIEWDNGSLTDTTVHAVIVSDTVKTGITVAGGNGLGPSENQFDDPFSVFVDSAGYIYVPDGGNNRVQKFPPGSSRATNGVTVAGGNGPGTAANQLIAPTSVFLDPAGYLYVADNENYRVQKFPPNSTSVSDAVTVAGGNGQGMAANQFASLTSVVVDKKGNIYVCDGLNNRIQFFPPGSSVFTDGITVAGGAGPGSEAYQLSNPTCVFVDQKGFIYVADYNNNRIQRFPPGSRSGTPGVTVAGANGPGTAADQLNEPFAVFVDQSGDIYVSDAINNRVQEFLPGSTVGITVAGGAGPGRGSNQLNEPYSIFVDTAGNLFVADFRNDRVQEFPPYTTLIDKKYIPGVSGEYTAKVIDSAGCSVVTNPVDVAPYLEPSVSIEASGTTICQGDIVFFSAREVNGDSSSTYQWTVNGKDSGENSNLFHTASLNNGDIVNCIFTSGNTCTVAVSSPDSVMMIVNPVPKIIFSPDTVVIRPGSSARLIPLITDAYNSFQWSPRDGLDDAGNIQPTASPLTTSIYHLSITGSDGCNASTGVTVLVYSPLIMPGAFSPNNDGKNDVFRIPPSRMQDIKSFSVFNRLGTRVYLSTGNAAGWDGTFNHVPQPAGTYVWIIQYRDLLSGKHEVAKGTVVLIR